MRVASGHKSVASWLTQLCRALLCVSIIFTFQLLPFTSAQAQPAQEKTRILIILDCSNSMWDHWQSNSKIKVTQQVLLSFLDSISRQHDVDVALRVFGHVNKEQFTTRLEVPFGADNYYRLQSKIKTLVPQGDCMAAEALTDAVSDFPATGSSRNLILIITDGMDDCEAEICEVAREVQLSGVVVQTFVLGIGGGTFNHASCAGNVSAVPREEQFATTLYDIFRLSGKKAKVVLKLIDGNGELYETEHPVVLCDHRTGVPRLNTIYHVDFRLRPDTLLLDPLVIYDMHLYTNPLLSRNELRFDVDRVNTVEVAVSEGAIKIRQEGRRVQGQMPDVVVWKDGKMVTTMQPGEPVKLLQGSYDVEIQTMPVTLLHDVAVRGGATTELTIPALGMLMLSKPKEITSGAIFKGLVHVTDLNPNTASERLTLLPGEYEVVLHPQQSTLYDHVQTRRFVIVGGQTTKLVF